jgi:hypothetical protein
MQETAQFDPLTEAWTRRVTMLVGRWYPTLLTLGDGTIFIASGKDNNKGDLNRILEIYDPAANTLSPRAEPTTNFPGLPYYAHLFLLEDGRLFHSGGRMDDPNPQQAGLLTLGPAAVAFQPVASNVMTEMRNQSASVLLPPAQAQQVMIIGGGPPDDRTSATGYTERIDLTAADPSFDLVMPMALPRMHLNAVLLPDRTVFVSGGAIEHEADRVAHVPRLQAEIYHPEIDRWAAAATASVVRMYHSVALLLPDGRVLTASGNPPPYGTGSAWVEQPNEELKIEIYSPPYLFAGARPTFTVDATEWNYGADITVRSATAAGVHWLELIRPGVTTHSFDNAQRLVDLPINSRDASSLRVTAPASPNLAPPGWYMLFIVDDTGVPSEATWIRMV